MLGAGLRASAVLVLLLWGLASQASAATTITGAEDSNAPLVIDPSSDPDDALTVEMSLTTNQTVAFVQRMPVTKVVNEVTLGDIGQAASCGAPTRTKLYVREHDSGNAELGGDFSQSIQVADSTGYVSLPASPGKVTWSIPATKLRSGRGYSFLLVANYSGTDCKLARYTTWAHDAAEVNAGPATCTGAPLIKRQWHVNGADDAAASCVSRPPGFRQFSPNMPTGWLVSRFAGSNWDILTARHASGSTSNACSTGTNTEPSDLGATEVFWQQLPNTNPDWVCVWQQYADHGTTVQDGWYYALPWLTQRDGAPRAMYLELDTIDYDALLAAYAPILAFDGGENFYPQEAGAFTDFWEQIGDGYLLHSDYVNILFSESGEELAAAGSPGPGSGPWPPVMVLGTLGENYWFGPDPGDQPAAASTDYIDARGSSESTYSTDAATQYAAGYDDVVYGRVVHDPDDGKLWLQYWVFYYFNSFNVLGVGYHEGDWEMVQVGLSSANVPDVMTFAAHTEGYRLDWGSVEKGGSLGASPIVYVASRSHASYPEAGQTELFPLVNDNHQGDGVWKVLPLEQVSSEDRWTSWPGRWGSSPAAAAAPSPPNPSEQGDKWSNPSAFHAGASAW